jgi:hypothetical protein
MNETSVIIHGNFFKSSEAKMIAFKEHGLWLYSHINDQSQIVCNEYNSNI